MDAGWGWMVCVAWRLGNGEGGGEGLGWVGGGRRVAKRGDVGRDKKGKEEGGGGNGLLDWSGGRGGILND